MLTGWGEGTSALPAPVGSAPAVPPPTLLTVPTPALDGERFRRATRECLLAVAAVRAALADAGVDRAELAGPRTGMLYASATAYAAANRAFLEDEGSTTLHFPYTAPSAVPGEVTIEYGIRGPYVNLMGGAPAALSGLWYAARWLADGLADRVLVLAVETMHEIRDLFGPGAAAASPPAGGRRGLRPPGARRRWRAALGHGRARRGRPDAAVTGVLDGVLGDAVPAVVGDCGGTSRGGPCRARRARPARRGACCRERPGRAARLRAAPGPGRRADPWRRLHPADRSLAKRIRGPVVAGDDLTGEGTWTSARSSTSCAT